MEITENRSTNPSVRRRARLLDFLVAPALFWIMFVVWCFPSRKYAVEYRMRFTVAEKE